MGSGAFSGFSSNTIIPDNTIEVEVPFINTTSFECEDRLMYIASNIFSHRKIDHKMRIDDREVKVCFSRLAIFITDFMRATFNIDRKIKYFYDDKWVIRVYPSKEFYKCENGSIDKIFLSDVTNVAGEEKDKILKIHKQLNKAYEICFGESEINCESLPKISSKEIERQVAYNKKLWGYYKGIQDRYIDYVNCDDIKIKHETDERIKDPITSKYGMQYVNLSAKFAGKIQNLLHGVKVTFGVQYICYDKKYEETKRLVLVGTKSNLSSIEKQYLIASNIEDMTYNNTDIFPLDATIKYTRMTEYTKTEPELPKKYRIIAMKLMCIAKLNIINDNLYGLGNIRELAREYFNEI